jgi:hypothetical protein
MVGCRCISLIERQHGEAHRHRDAVAIDVAGSVVALLPRARETRSPPLA